MAITNSLCDWSQFNEALARAHIQIDAHEAHGILSALLCLSFDARTETWVQALHANNNPTESDSVSNTYLVEQLAPDDKAIFDNLHAVTDYQLNDPELGFRLLLPEDDEPLNLRIQALAGWCQGFLLGISMCGLKKIEYFPAGSQEALHDLMEIAYNCEEAEDTNNENETAYFELVEHARMGVLLIHDEMLHLTQGKGVSIRH